MSARAAAQAASTADRSAEQRTALDAALREAEHWLPQQGPIDVFIHHNPLHALEHLPFHEAVLEAAERLGAQPYWSEAAYREAYRGGRIAREDLLGALRAQLGEPRPAQRALCAGVSVEALRELALLHELDVPEPEAAEFALAEGELAPELAQACLARLALAPPTELPAAPRAPWRRHRDAWVASGGADPDARVNPVLIALCAAQSDRGLARWRWQGERAGLYAAARELWRRRAPAALGAALAAELEQHAQLGLDARGAALRALHALGVPESRWADYVSAALLALPGWAGLWAWFGRHPEASPAALGPAPLLELLAVRLTLDRVALGTELRAAGRPADAARDLLAERPRGTAAAQPQPCARRRALQLGRVARLCGWSAGSVRGLSAGELRALLAALDQCGPLLRRRIWQEAYERHYRRQILLALAARAALGDDSPHEPLAQLVLCIDEREESLRRHLEEVEPRLETLSAAGFFGLAIDYRGLADAHYAPLCPVVLEPGHAVEERAHADDAGALRRLQRLERAWAGALGGASTASHSLWRGAVLTPLLGWCAALPLAATLLAPRAAARAAAGARRALLPAPRTALSRSARGERSAHGKPLGFALEEQVERVAGLLQSIALDGRLAPLLVVLGHGSTSLNNPHESAHDCGACGGRRGGPNARLFAAMANDPAVRAALAARGMPIPPQTWFVGGLHDTCSDAVELYDTDAVPAALRERLTAVHAALDAARARNAQERARRFELTRAGASPRAALRGVERRAVALDEPRPEYGHATNALCIVGRRALSRRLFLDRRAFLVSYDPARDPHGEILERTLAAVVPVCAGISLEYYFSFVDNQRYGCGSKLPHNVTGLVGVMNGHRSDLRAGLPWQMVEIHEPVRLLFAIEAEPERIAAIARRNPGIGRLFFNGWLQVASVHPRSGELAELDGERWLPLREAPPPLARAHSSWHWYRDQRGPLGPALVGAAPGAARLRVQHVG